MVTIMKYFSQNNLNDDAKGTLPLRVQCPAMKMIANQITKKQPKSSTWYSWNLVALNTKRLKGLSKIIILFQKLVTTVSFSQIIFNIPPVNNSRLCKKYCFKTLQNKWFASPLFFFTTYFFKYILYTSWKVLRMQKPAVPTLWIPWWYSLSPPSFGLWEPLLVCPSWCYCHICVCAYFLAVISYRPCGLTGFGGFR